MGQGRDFSVTCWEFLSDFSLGFPLFMKDYFPFYVRILLSRYD